MMNILYYSLSLSLATRELNNFKIFIKKTSFNKESIEEELEMSRVLIYVALLVAKYKPRGNGLGQRNIFALAFYNFTSTVRGHNRYEPLYSGVASKSKNDRTIFGKKLSGDSFNRAHPRAVAEE